MALLVIDGAVNGDLFKQPLIPVLHTGDIVIMDDVSIGVRETSETAGVSPWFLPPLQPRSETEIENASSKFKWLIKNSKERTVTAPWKKCGELIGSWSN